MSSSASISAAKRRRGPQPSMAPPQNRGQQQQQQRGQPQQGKRINPMAILENHELRLRDIEKTKSDEGGSVVVPQNDEKVEALVKENGLLNQKIEIMKEKIISLERTTQDLLKLKNVVFDLQTSVLSNSQKVEALKDFKDGSNSEIISADVAQEIEDVTQTMSSATIDYGDTQVNTTSTNVNSSADGNEEVASSGNVTFTVVESETSQQQQADA